MSCTDNTMVSYSGYTNTCESSQSQGRNEALPQPISTKKIKEQKKKKFKTSTIISSDITPVFESVDQQTSSGTYSSNSNASNQLLKKSEEVGIMELVNVTDSDEHNGDLNSIAPKGGLGYQTNPLDNTSPNMNGEFYTVVSLHDGLVVQSTATLQKALGYPKDNWLGRSFIDFIHIKDRPTFTHKLANGIVLLFNNRRKGLNKCQTNLFCNLKRYSDPLTIKNEVNNKTRQLREKYKIMNNTKADEVDQPYVPFHLSLEFENFRKRKRSNRQKTILLTITAAPVFSAYKIPEETIVSSTFSTHHTPNCQFSYVDDDVVKYFGYLPQDMVGQSLFDFYHPEDLPFIKEIYKNVIRLEGSSFKSKPYRFAVQNGGYVILETEWSSFINPWERKLEFIVGHHRVLRGPVNPDVFQLSEDGRYSFRDNISEEVLKESRIIQNEIHAILAEEPDSVMLKEISPHHGYCDSKFSSETPPTYNQLNYNEKIERFFNSKPLFQKSGDVELVDATDPGEHNGDSNCIVPKNGIISEDNRLLNTSSNVNEEFYTVVSLQDGLVLNSTASLQTALGYPKNSWPNRSFLDFVHPQDRITFFNKLACGIILPSEDQKNDLTGSQMGLFCNLKRFNNKGLENGNAKMNPEQYTEKLKFNGDNNINLTYAPFHLSLGFKNFEKNYHDKKIRMTLLTIIAEPVFSAYKAPEEIIVSSTFSTRHTPNCQFSYVDDDVVKYFGYFPQDMVGQSLFNFYHPEDLLFIKDIYETVVKLDESSFRSKPYRFAVKNGGYVILETEWSSFINPWERKLEFIVGHHRVLRGPVNPDVFQQPEDGCHSFRDNISEEVLEESQIIQNEIRTLLAEKIQTPTGKNSCDIKQSNDLTLFMENLMKEVKKPLPTFNMTMFDYEKSFSQHQLQIVESCYNTLVKGSRNPLLQEHDSVMLGEISPHHEYCDSKSFNQTPTYNQLNYNDKMERFLNNEFLHTTIDGSYPSGIGKPFQNRFSHASNYCPLNQDSNGSGSGENLNSDLRNQTNSSKENNSHGNSSDSVIVDNSKMPTLTKRLLSKHTHQMEKLMILKHKERRSNIKNRKLSKNSRISANSKKDSAKQEILQTKPRACKRKSDIHEHQCVKILKQDRNLNNCNKNNNLPRNETKADKITVNQSSANINVMPRITFATSHYVTPQAVTAYSAISQVIPIYYVPVTQAKNYPFYELPSRNINQPSSYGHTPLSGVIYPSVIASTPVPIVYASPMMVQVPTVQNNNIQKPVPALQKLSGLKIPASQATSIMTESGSTLTMSDSSKKISSPKNHFSSYVSGDGDFPILTRPQATNITRRNSQADSSMEDSSDSSFYGSFLNTSSGSSFPDQIRANNLSEKIISKNCNGDKTDHRRFSMVTELKANFESQALRGNLLTAQKVPKKSSAPQLNNEKLKERTPVDPPWLQNVKMTPELIYQYQMSLKPLNEVLEADMLALNKINQPLLVNDQLDQLYLDLELGGFSTKLNLDDCNNSNDSDHSRSETVLSQHRQIRREIEHSKLAMIYEENAPLSMA